jgi:hypothetical protein
MEEDDAFMVVLMHAKDGSIDFDKEENMILTRKPSHKSAMDYAAALSKMVRFQALEFG